MKTRHIHITGASGSGTTTLGRAVASALGISHHDTDDYFWAPTDPPYTQIRERADRIRLMHEMFLERPDWVLSGSLTGWGDGLVPHFDLVAFLSVATEKRINRLRGREVSRFGRDAVAPGGWRYEETKDFLEWASRYEEGSVFSRSRVDHEAWLAKIPCLILRLDGSQPLPTLTQQVLAACRAQEPKVTQLETEVARSDTQR